MQNQILFYKSESRFRKIKRTIKEYNASDEFSGTNPVMRFGIMIVLSIFLTVACFIPSR